MQDDYYHIFNRGVNRCKVFQTHQDYLLCLKKIKEYCQKYVIQMIAYCLMPNHYHFLVRQDGDTSVSRWVQTIFNGYVQTVNQKFNRKGTLFESRCRIKQVDKEAYLMHLVRYIHLNPVHANLVHHVKDWPYSNYPEWTGGRLGSLFCHAFIDRWFDSPASYQAFVKEYEDIRLDQKIDKYLFD